MDKNQQGKMQEKVEKVITQHEDAALKTAMHFFAEELLPYLGVEGKVTGIAPTELVHLELKKMYQDTNLIMEDGSWKHFEFQSTNEGIAGLKRFRIYEAVTSEQYSVPVTTYVLFSGKIKRPMTEFTEGINTYRVIPIIMQNENADEFIGELLRKKEAKEPITKEEFVRLTLCPLMGGSMKMKERIKAAYKITEDAESVSEEELRKIEAVIYAMADKFLESMDMEEIKEDMRMTRLGQMLVNEGAEKKAMEVARNLIGILADEAIIEKVGISWGMLEKIKQENRDSIHDDKK